MEAKAVRVDTQLWGGRHGSARQALQAQYAFYGPGFTVECPTGSGMQMNLFEVAREIARRLTRHFPARRE